MSDEQTSSEGSEGLSELRRLLAESTPGVWKLWGMQVMADQDGTSNVDTAAPVAQTYFRDENGNPRTWDASLIATAHNLLPELLDAAARAESSAAALDTARREADELRARLGALADDIWRESQQGHVIIREAGVMQDIVPRIRALLANPPAEPWLCSQCDEQESAMVKIGTSDGWCVACLDEAAAPWTNDPDAWIGHPANLPATAKPSCLAGGCEWGDRTGPECCSPAVQREGEVGARALREAADDMVWDFADHPVTRSAVREWLHGQANALAPTANGDRNE